MSESVNAIPSPAPVFDVQVQQASQLANAIDETNNASFLAAISQTADSDNNATIATNV